VREQMEAFLKSIVTALPRIATTLILLVIPMLPVVVLQDGEVHNYYCPYGDTPYKLDA